MNPDRDQAQPIPPEVGTYCRDQGWGEITAIQVLKGGVISLTQQLTTAERTSLILKRSVKPPADLYWCEARGLQVLRAAGLHTPEVLLVGSDFVLLENVGSRRPDQASWAALGRALAQLHEHTNSVFGFERDNYLGLLPQVNRWTGDGHEFFVRYRMLRYLSVPLCEQTLTAQDRRNVERLAARLPDLIPAQPASLLHGDLWRENVLADAHGAPIVIDPAIYYGWAEAELSMVRQYEGVPREFFAAYTECRPLAEGWWERLELLYVREILSVIAHFGNRGSTLEQLRSIIDKFV